MPQNLEIPLPDDFHIHLRQGKDLASYAKSASEQFGRVLAMPNTEPPINSPEAVKKYKEEILAAAPSLEVLLTFKLNKNYTEQELFSMQKNGAPAAKYYPIGVTTNSQDGVSKIEDMYPTIELMEKLNLVLCLHGEEPGAFCLDREKEFLKHIEKLCKTFPKLRIVLEHVSSSEAVDCVKSLPENVAATVTVHHLILTLNDIVGDSLRPQNFCKPLPKLPKDKEAVRAAVFSGDKKFFLGTDSAPHSLEKKECLCGAAGVYSAPVAIPILIEEFERENKLDLLSNFLAGFGADFYGISRQKKKVLYTKKEWQVPKIIDGAAPLCAGEVLSWSFLNYLP
ncbi:MAG: dihydroorotase [Fibromonadaceae bacterium]|jgi:dihydroorotase|nr:dihydroorotase [Fibromonadaceae bacterium]